MRSSPGDTLLPAEVVDGLAVHRHQRPQQPLAAAVFAHGVGVDPAALDVQIPAQLADPPGGVQHTAGAAQLLGGDKSLPGHIAGQVVHRVADHNDKAVGVKGAELGQDGVHDLLVALPQVVTGLAHLTAKPGGDDDNVAVAAVLIVPSPNAGSAERADAVADVQRLAIRRPDVQVHKDDHIHGGDEVQRVTDGGPDAAAADDGDFSCHNAMVPLWYCCQEVILPSCRWPRRSGRR